ncbi:helix-turn-helix domain-containing protein [Gallibacterium sp. AGMB14963]|uniref:helix-turn-helix domain-containing protein n=1 Tax=Gallibacterium faecale TaxID=3019086 RepID=UPI0022F1617F|nr:S24 family peptidase [Gallibacterium sp. AGMB14963]MDA3978803.1 DNA-binding protein [Gallibacterium sp. AGMB14963]
MKSLKEWFTAKELEGLPGLPSLATNITRKAKQDGWLTRNASGIKGGGNEYHITSLPKEASDRLIQLSRINGIKESLIAKNNDTIEESIDHDNESFSNIVDLRSVEVSAGFGRFNEEHQDVKYTLVEKAWLQKRGLKAKDCAMFKVVGDSMYPTIKDGDDILVDRSKTKLTEGQIFVINHMGSMWVKKIQIGFTGIELISDNTEYVPIKISWDDANSLRTIGKVVRIYKDM